MSRPDARNYNGIPPEAAQQFRASLAELLYPNGTNTLRRDAFGHYPEQVLDESVRTKAQTMLSTGLNHAGKERALDAMTALACADEPYFHQIYRGMIQQRMPTPFYDAFNQTMARKSNARTDADIAAEGLILGMHGEAPDAARLLSQTNLGIGGARGVAKILADRAQTIAKENRTEAPIDPAMSKNWEQNGLMALERAEQVDHTRDALRAIESGDLKQFRIDTTPEGIRDAQIAQAQNRAERS